MMPEPDRALSWRLYFPRLTVDAEFVRAIMYIMLERAFHGACLYTLAARANCTVQSQSASMFLLGSQCQFMSQA